MFQAGKARQCVGHAVFDYEIQTKTAFGLLGIFAPALEKRPDFFQAA